MSRTACVWADLGDDTTVDQWYEDEHIPNVVARLGTRARNAQQAEENIFKEVAGIEGAHMTVYDLPDVTDAQDLDAQIRPALDTLSGKAKLDARCYAEYANWFGDAWRGDARDIQMWVVALWQPAETVHDQIIDWVREEFTPGLLESPELLRSRIFKLEHASLVHDQKHEQQNTGSIYQYMTLYEFDCDEMPWEILVYLGGSERWRHYVEGGNLDWQIGHYLVDRIYPGGDDADSPAAT